MDQKSSRSSSHTRVTAHQKLSPCHSYKMYFSLNSALVVLYLSQLPTNLVGKKLLANGKRGCKYNYVPRTFEKPKSANLKGHFFTFSTGELICNGHIKVFWCRSHVFFKSTLVAAKFSALSAKCSISNIYVAIMTSADFKPTFMQPLQCHGQSNTSKIQNFMFCP